MTRSPAVIILAGGKSTRFKRDKVLSEFPPGSGQTLLEHLLSRFGRYSEVVIVVSRRLYAAVKPIAGPEATVVTDEVRDLGPLEGLRVGLKQLSGQYAFVVACDQPFASPELGCFLHGLAATMKADVVAVKIGGYLEPLQAIYSKLCVVEIERALSRGERRIISFYDHVATSIVDIEQLPEGLRSRRTFLNINSPTDYEEAVRRWV